MYLLWNGLTDVRVCSLWQKCLQDQTPPPFQGKKSSSEAQKSDSIQRDQNGHQFLPVTFCQKVFPIPYTERQQYLPAIKD